MARTTPTSKDPGQSVDDNAALGHLSSLGVPKKFARELLKKLRAVKAHLTSDDLNLTVVAFEFGRQSIPSTATQDDSLPLVAPKLYEDREDRSEDPVAFMNRIWGEWLNNGTLFQDQLRRFDPKLIPAIKSYCQRRNLDAKAVLPPPKHVRLKNATGPETQWIQQMVDAHRSVADELAQRYKGK